MTNINIVKLDKGNFRSIHGYAAESLVIGEALLAGYNLFFKAWRDSAYDAVLDYGGVLYRIEIKGTSKDEELSVTSGGRTGKQISRTAGKREHIVSPADCEFVIGVSSMTREFYIIPTECLSIFNRNSLSLEVLLPFKNAWKIFLGVDGITPKQLRDGFLSMTDADLQGICSARGVVIPANNVPWGGFRGKRISIPDNKKRMVLCLWKHLFLKASEA